MPKPKTLYCIECGYNLTGVCSEEQPVGRCPECGDRFDRADLIRRANEPTPPTLPRWPTIMLFAWPVLAAVLLVFGAWRFVVRARQAKLAGGLAAR